MSLADLPSPDGVFNLGPKIGKGAYGSVFRATHIESGADVAIKVMEFDEADEAALQDLSKEVEILSKMTHDNIPSYYGTYSKGKEIWLSMEFMDVGSAQDLLKNQRKGSANVEDRLTEQEIAAILKHTCVGLQFLHKNNVIHRDIKGANILLHSSGWAKLADFGVSAKLESAMDQKQTAIGSPYWMAPELILEEPYSSLVDVWSLGITAVELADGRPPLSNHLPVSALFYIASGDGEPPGLQNKDEWSAHFIEFIDKCLQREPEDRCKVDELLETEFIRSVSNAEEVIRTMCARIMKGMPSIDEADSDSSTQNTISSEHTTELLPVVNPGAFLVELRNDFKKSAYYKSLRSAEKPSDDSVLEFLEIRVVDKMRSPVYGVSVQDRFDTRSDDVYANSFCGKDAIDWIYANLELHSRDEGVALASNLLGSELILPLKVKGVLGKMDDDENALYTYNVSLIQKCLLVYEKEREKFLGGVSRADEEESTEAEELDETGLTRMDWHRLCEEGEVKRYYADEMILREGDPNDHLFRVKSGDVRVEKVISGESVKLALMSEGKMFGEMSVVGHLGGASASCVADTEVELHQISFTGMVSLFEREPGLARRFYVHVAKRLAQRLKELPVASAAPRGSSDASTESSDTPRKRSSSVRVDDGLGGSSRARAGSSAKGSRNKKTGKGGGDGGDAVSPRKSYEPRELEKLRRLFTLPPLEPVLCDYEASLKKVMVHAGRMYITPNYLCFGSSIFGYKKNEVYPFSHITDIRKKQNELIISMGRKKKVSIKISKSAQANEAYRCILDMKKEHEGDSVRRATLKEDPKRNTSSDSLRKTHSSALRQRKSKKKEILRPDDWDLLLKGFMGMRLETFRDSTIIREGKYYNRIYQIARGSCDIIKGKGKGKKKLGKMKAGEVFGEIGFLLGIPSTATVKAHGTVQVYVIEGYYLGILFLKRPSLAGRFYHHLANELAKRVAKRERSIVRRKERKEF